MTNLQIEKLEAKGFKRWTKGGMDRMYVNASALGLECEYYNTGNIRYAEFQGEKVSNSQAAKMRYAKTYIDLKDNTAHSTHYTLQEAVDAILAEVTES